MKHFPELVKITDPYLEQETLGAVFNIYISEAHPTDGWALESNEKEGICIAKTKTLEARLKAAKAFQAHWEGTGFEGWPVLVDDPKTQNLEKAFEAFPERLVVLDAEFKVVFATGQGPFQYNTQSLASFLERCANGETYASTTPSASL